MRVSHRDSTPPDRRRLLDRQIRTVVSLGHVVLVLKVLQYDGLDRRSCAPAVAVSYFRRSSTDLE